MAQSIGFGARSTADQVLAGVDLTRKRMVVTACESGHQIATAIRATYQIASQAVASNSAVLDRQSLMSRRPDRAERVPWARGSIAVRTTKILLEKKDRSASSARSQPSAPADGLGL
jgi:hypothetical protein